MARANDADLLDHQAEPLEFGTLPTAAKTATLSRILSPRSILHFMMVTSVRSGPSAQGAEKQRDFLCALVRLTGNTTLW